MFSGEFLIFLRTRVLQNASERLLVKLPYSTQIRKSAEQMIWIFWPSVWSNSFLLTFNYRKCEKSINSTKDIVLEMPPTNPLGVNSTKWSNTLK